MPIGPFTLLDNVLIVAEIGNNHEGDIRVAKTLVRQAAACGADAVKCQTFRTEHYVSSSNADRFARLKSFELCRADFEELAHLARSLKLRFFSTPFDLASAAFLEPLVDAYKVASGDNRFYPLIAEIARTGKPLIVSTGASDLAQVTRTVAFINAQWDQRGHQGELAMLHCVSSYPVEPEQANLLSIPCLAEALDCTIGYSDHTIGIEAAVLSVALGARIIEKHFTLDHALSDFRDHQLSADPTQMRELVRRVRQARVMLGTRRKTIQPCEESGLAELRRSIVAGADLPAGHRVAWSDLTWIRPAGGLSPGEERVLVGKRLTRNVRFGERLQATDVA